MEEMQKRIEIIAKNAEARVNEVQQPVGKDAAFYQRFARVPVAPIFIASTEGTRQNPLVHKILSHAFSFVK